MANLLAVGRTKTGGAVAGPARESGSSYFFFLGRGGSYPSDRIFKKATMAASSSSVNFKSPNSAVFHILGYLRRGPAFCFPRFCLGVRSGTNRFYVPRVVEVHNALEAFEVAVVTIGLYTPIKVPQVHVAESRDLVLAHVGVRIFCIVRPRGKEPTKPKVDKCWIVIIDGFSGFFGRRGCHR